MTDALGTARDYASLQAVLRIRADALGISRETIDRLAGVPAGYAAKTLAEVPIKRLGPDTIGPMLGALGVMLSVVADPEAEARHTSRGEQRVEKYALNAAKLNGVVHFKISLRKMRQNGRKGGAASRKYMTRREARKLARKAARARWHKAKPAKPSRAVCVAAPI